MSRNLFRTHLKTRNMKSKISTIDEKVTKLIDLVEDLVLRGKADVVSHSEAAQMLGVDSHTLTRYRREGKVHNVSCDGEKPKYLADEVVELKRFRQRNR